jgi:membrane fusion protein (multidrug efflux system)
LTRLPGDAAALDSEHSDVTKPWAATLRVLLVLLVIVAVWFFATHWDTWTGQAVVQSTDDAYLESDVVPLSARVPGLVRSVNVNDNEIVRKGQVLVEIEDDDYRASLAQADASLLQGRATMAVLEHQRSQQSATIDASEAGVTSATAAATLSHIDAVRQHDLLTQGHYASQQAVDQADAGDKQATAARVQQRAQSTVARRALDALDAQVAVQLAVVAELKAADDLARINLGYTRIRAPGDGMVGTLQVRPGQYMAVGAQAVSLVALPRIWVLANFKETQMTNVRVGERATVSIDAFPGARFVGRVDSWAPASGARFALLPPDNATGNFTKVIQRLTVKITLDATSSGLSSADLRPGMSAVASVDTSTAPRH